VQGGKGEVILWDTGTGRAVLSLPGNVAVAFSADGARLAAASSDLYLTSGVRLWDTAPAGGVRSGRRLTRVTRRSPNPSLP
jgi:hypothetical protein